MRLVDMWAAQYNKVYFSYIYFKIWKNLELNETSKLRGGEERSQNVSALNFRSDHERPERILSPLSRITVQSETGASLTPVQYLSRSVLEHKHYWTHVVKCTIPATLKDSINDNGLQRWPKGRALSHRPAKMRALWVDSYRLPSRNRSSWCGDAWADPTRKILLRAPVGSPPSRMD